MSLGKTCRLSDATLVDLNGSTQIDLGKIAKPLGTGTAVDHSDTLNIYYSGDGCPWIGVSTWSCPFVGRPFEIVGRSSGREVGTLTDTCSDQPAPAQAFGQNRVFLCQGGATYTAIDGDSGAPVFLDKGPYGTSAYLGEVRLFGIHWGSQNQGNKKWFSMMWAIRQELGDGSGSSCAGMDLALGGNC